MDYVEKGGEIEGERRKNDDNDDVDKAASEDEKDSWPDPLEECSQKWNWISPEQTSSEFQMRWKRPCNLPERESLRNWVGIQNFGIGFPTMEIDGPFQPSE